MVELEINDMSLRCDTLERSQVASCDAQPWALQWGHKTRGEGQTCRVASLCANFTATR
jgi:hypothetical protein